MQKPQVTEELLFFGGPLNEQILPVREDVDLYKAIMPDKSANKYDPNEYKKPVESTVRRVIYKRNMLWYKSTATAEPEIFYVMLAEGYPLERVSGAIGVIMALCKIRWVWGNKGDLL